MATVRGEKERAIVVLGTSLEECQKLYLNAWMGMDREVRLRTTGVHTYRWKYTGENCGYWWRLQPIDQLDSPYRNSDHVYTRRYDA